MTSMQRFDCDGLTDPGRVRGVNGDQFLIADLRKTLLIHGTSVDFAEHEPIWGGAQGRLLMVADGGDGWTAERQASELVVQTITRYILNMMPWPRHSLYGSPKSLILITSFLDLDLTL